MSTINRRSSVSGYAVKFATENVGLEPTDANLTEKLKTCVRRPPFKLLEPIRREVKAYRESREYAEWLAREAAEREAERREAEYGVPLADVFAGQESGAVQGKLSGAGEMGGAV